MKVTLIPPKDDSDVFEEKTLHAVASIKQSLSGVIRLFLYDGSRRRVAGKGWLLEVERELP